MYKDSKQSYMGDQSHMRFSNESFGSPAVDIYANNIKVASFFVCSNSTEYRQFKPGRYYISVYIAGSKTNLITESYVNLRPNMDCTITVIGLLPNISLLAIVDKFTPISPNKTQAEFDYSRQHSPFGHLYTNDKIIPKNSPNTQTSGEEIPVPSNINEKPDELQKSRQELKEKRTRNSKSYINSDNTITEEIYLDPQHYQELPDIQWKEINNNLIASTEKRDGFQNKSNDYKAHFPIEVDNDEIVSIIKNNTIIGFIPTDTKKVKGIVENNTITYENIYPNTDIRYSTNNSQVKEDIILKSFTGKNTFSFELKLKGLYVEEDESDRIVFKDSEGENVWLIKEPFMVDADNKISNNVKFILNEKNGKKFIHIVADKEFLKDANTKYPVAIDPSLTTWDVLRDTFVANYFPNNSYSSLTLTYTGSDPYYYGTMRTLVQFSLPSIPSGSEILSANFNAYQTKVDSTVVSIDLYRIIGSSWTGSVTWNTQPEIAPLKESTVTSNVDNSFWSWNITQLFKDWRNGNQANYGFMLMQENEDTSPFRAFRTLNNPSNKPNLTINYGSAQTITDGGYYGQELIIEVAAGQWYKVMFDQYGLANFWINPESTGLNLDLFVYENAPSGRLIGSSTNATGQELISQVPVKAGVYYYIYVKNTNWSAGYFALSSRNYPQNVTVNPPTNVEANVAVDGLNVTLNFVKGENSTKTAIKNAETGNFILTTTNDKAYLMFGTYNKNYILHLYGVNGSTYSTNYEVVELTTGTAVIDRGDTGSEVRGVQEMLFELGYLGSSSDVDGIFGPMTENAVKAYQRDMGLPDNGVVDATTKGRLADSTRSLRLQTATILTQSGLFKNLGLNLYMIAEKEYVIYNTPLMTVKSRLSIFPTAAISDISFDLLNSRAVSGTLYNNGMIVENQFRLQSGQINSALTYIGAEIADLPSGSVRLKVPTYSPPTPYQATMVLEYSINYGGHNWYQTLEFTFRNLSNTNTPAVVTAYEPAISTQDSLSNYFNIDSSKVSELAVVGGLLIVGIAALIYFAPATAVLGIAAVGVSAGIADEI